MSRLISIAKASEMLGVTTKTLKIWTNEDKIKCYRTVGGHRRFKIEEIEKFLGEETESNNFNYLKECAKNSGAQIEALEEKKKLEQNEEMVKDLIRIVTCFSARLYGARGGKRIKKVIAELETERSENNESNNKSIIN